MALQYTSRGPGYGVISTPMGDMYATDAQAAQYGIAPPQVDSAALDAAPLAPPPMEQEAPILPLPPEPLPSAPVDPLAGMAPPEATGNPFSRTPTPPPDQVAPVPASTNAPAPMNTPEQVAPARVDLSATTYSDVLAEQQAAQQQGATAGAAQLEAQAAGADRQAAALELRNAAIAAKEQEFAQQQADDQARLAKTTATYEAKVKEFADAKVDRSNYRVSPLAALGVLISGIGAAKNGSNQNPALDLLMRQIDQYVEDGYRKKAALGQDAALVKDQIGMLQGAAANTVAQKQLAIAGLTEKAARDLEAIGAKQAGLEKRTAILGLASDARMAGAQALGQAVQLQHGEDQQKAQRDQQERESRRSAGAAAARLREDARQFDKTFDQREQERVATKSAAIASATSAIDVENAKKEVADLKMRGIGPDGKPVESNYRAKNEKTGDEVAQMHASVVTLDGLMAEAIRLRKEYPHLAKDRKSPEYQKLMANVSAAGIAWAKSNQMGAWDNGTAKAVLGAQGGDPMRDGYLTDTIGRYLQGDASVGLEQFRKNSVGKLNDFARSVRDPRGGDYVPIEPIVATFDKPDTSKIDETVDAIRNAKTPDEIRASSQRGWSTRLPGDRADTADAKARAAADPKDSTGATSKVQGDGVRDLALIATTGKNANGTAMDAASALKALEGLATEIDKKPAAANLAMQTLAEMGNEDALSRVEAALVAAAPKNERDKEVARATVRFARERVAGDRAAQGFQAPPSIDALAAAAAAGDKTAASALLSMASGKQAMSGPLVTAEQRLRANAAIMALGKKRSGR